MESMTPSQKELVDEESGAVIYLPKDHNLKRWGLAALGGVVVILVSLFSIIISLETYTAVQRHGRGILLNKITPLLPLLFLGLPVGISLILWAKNHWEDRLILSEKEIVQRKGESVITWPYQKTQRLDTSITNINFGGSIVGTKVKIFLEDGDQHHLILHHQYEDMADLIEGIRKKIIPDLYKKALQKLSRGEEIIFHPNLMVSKDGIHANKHHLQWDHDIITVIKNNKLILTKQEEQDQIFTSSVNKVKSLDLLQCLLENTPVFDD